MNNISQMTGTVYPDRTFSIGRVPRQRKGVREREYDRDYASQIDSYIETTSKYGEATHSEVSFFRGIEKCDRFIKDPKSSRKRGKYGGKGITGYGKKVVKCSAILLQKKYGRQSMGFCTLTLPSLAEESLKYLFSSWSQVGRRFFQKYKRACEKKSCVSHYVGVTEIQEKRYKRTGLPVLHIHFAYIARRSGRDRPFFFTPSDFRRWWRESIEQVLLKGGYTPDYEETYKASVDCQVVKKSVAAYLGKYLSKGSGVVADIIEKGGAYMLPSQWWFACMQTKRMYTKSLVTLTGEECKALFYGLEHYLHDATIEWARFVDVEINERWYRLGLVGILSVEAYSIFVRN